jgi:hypothetical protein
LRPSKRDFGSPGDRDERKLLDTIVDKYPPFLAASPRLNLTAMVPSVGSAPAEAAL